MAALLDGTGTPSPHTLSPAQSQSEYTFDAVSESTRLVPGSRIVT
jgi:hypothetical protein